MKFEGTQVNIPIKGIMRAGTDNLCADGAMNEVVGMEYKDGSWLPYKEGEQELEVNVEEDPTQPMDDPEKEWDAVTNIVDVYTHKTSDSGERFLFLLSDGKLLYEHHRDSLQPAAVFTKVLVESGVKSVSFVGNAVCVATADSGLQTYLWKTDSYSKIGETDFSLPYISLRTTSGLKRKNSSVLTTGIYKCEQYVQDAYFDDTHPTNRQINRAMNELLQSTLISVLGEARDRGALTGYCLGCVAFRMNNGEFIAASAPVLLSRPMSAFGSGEDGYREVFYDSEDDSLTDELNYTTAQGQQTTKIYSYHTDAQPEGTYDDYVVFPVKYSNDSYSYDDRKGSYEIYETTTNKKSQIVASDATYIRLHWNTRDSLIPTVSNKVYTPSVHSAFVADSYVQDDKRNWYISAFAAYAGLQYKIQDSIDIDTLKQYGVESICIFITPEVSPYYVSDKAKLHNTFSRSGDFMTIMSHQGSSEMVADYHGRSQQIRRKKASEIIEELKELGGFYMVEEVFLEDIDTTQTPDWTNIDLEGKLGDTLVTLEQLPLSALNGIKTFPEHLDAYNYRLHAYDYMQELFKGFDLRQYNYYEGYGQIEEAEFSLLAILGNENIKWEIQVELELEDGNAAVVNYDNVGVRPCLSTLSSFISYPDTKARSITIIAYRQTANVERLTAWKVQLPLTALHNMGMAAYITSDLAPVDLKDGDSVEHKTTVPNLNEYNNERYYHNGLKVSDVAYPSYFPMEYTYRIGNEKIIGLARLSMPMSQDNFGNYSLIVFCTDGIYSLRVDTSGNGVYTTQAFVSPEVCVNPNSICEIGGAVFFAGDKGLMILTGENNVELYAPQLNGVPRFLPANSHSKEAHGVYRKMIDSTQILSQSTEGDYYDSISKEDFKDFITDQETHLIYISNKNKLFAYNGKKVKGVRAYDFSYFIDIPTRNTTKLAMTALCDDGDIIGRTIWENNTNTYTVHTFGYLSESDNSIPCLVQSRPIKVQQDDKCSYRVVLTGYFNGVQGHWADLVVLGSLDADHWRVIGVKEKKLVGGFHNLGCLTERGSWKYLMFIFAGQLSNNSHIDSVDITVDGRYNNKKR